MRLLKFILFIFLLALYSCGENAVTIRQSESDTLKVLRTAIHQGISDEYMPSASPLKRQYHFGDSILLTSEILSLDLLPTRVQDQSFKVLSKEEICSMIVADSAMSELPNYLNVSNFEKSDTGYYVQLRSLGCLPFSGGGSLGLYFKRIGDSLTIVDRTMSSIN